MEITTRILCKNEKFSKEFTALKFRKQNFSAKINQLHEKLVGIKNLLTRPRINAFYKIVSKNAEKNMSVGRILAETFMLDSKNVPLVAKISDKNLEMPTKFDK